MSDYSYLDIILHRLFLGDTPLSQHLYRRLLAKSTSYCHHAEYENHIFITGLARCGSTILLNQLYAENERGSLIYGNMPFVLSPRLSHFFSRIHPSSSDYIQRSHQDGIYISQDAPECLDEPFWIKSDPDYYTKPLSCLAQPSQAIINAYRYFLARYSELQQKKGLIIKNNNNHVRLASLINSFPNSKFLVLFRDPINHSNSLTRVHELFTQLHASTPFSLEYMNYIGHREFGANHSQFQYQALAPSANSFVKTLDLSYWLARWNESYSWLYSQDFYKSNNVAYVSYERICSDPEYLTRICFWLGLSMPTTVLLKNKNNSSIKANISASSEELLCECFDLYEKLQSISFA